MTVLKQEINEQAEQIKELLIYRWRAGPIAPSGAHNAGINKRPRWFPKREIIREKPVKANGCAFAQIPKDS